MRADRSRWQDFEESRFGRRVISILLVVTISSIVIWNLPPSEFKAAVHPTVAPYVRTAGLGQSWKLFAPSMRRSSQDVVARVEYADGSTMIWRPPDGDLLTSYRGYRWRKWLAELRLNDSESMWQPAAIYIAGVSERDGQLPTSVTLVRRSAAVPEPGSDDKPVWEEFDFYTLDVVAAGDTAVEE